MAVFLNFDINTFAIPIWIYLLIAAVGLLVPLLAALWPVLRRCGVPVREALADQGVSRNAFGTTGFDRLLTSFGGPARPLLLALRNSFRRRTRLALTLLTLALGGLFFMSALNLRTSMIKTLDGLSATKKADLSIGFGTMLPFESLRRAARGIAGVRDAEGSIATEGSIGASIQAQGPEHAGAGLHAQAAAGGERFVVLALPPETALWEPEIVEGRKLLPGGPRPLDMDMTGVLAAVVCPLAAAGVSLFGASTFDSDYVMVLEQDLPRAVAVLRRAGHRVEA